MKLRVTTTMNLLSWLMFLLIFFIKCYAIEQSNILSECNFANQNQHNCDWSNLQNNIIQWKISHIHILPFTDRTQPANGSFLVLKSDKNESIINSMYQSSSMSHAFSGICLKLRFIFSPNCTDCNLRIFSVINESENQFLREYPTNDKGYDWNEVETYFPLSTTDKFKILLLGHINSLDQQFIAIDYISLKSGYCNHIDSVIGLSASETNSTSNTSYVDPFKDKIGPRIAVWISIAAFLIVLSVGTFACIGLSNCRAEHKKREARSKLGNINQLKQINSDDIAEDVIFQDEFKIMPRGGSFIGSIIRQFSSKSLKSNR